MLAFFEEHLVQKGLASSTIVNYLADLRAFRRWAGSVVSPNFSLLDTTQEHIRRYRYFLVQEQARAVSTTNRHLMSLRKFFAFATLRGLLSRDPAAEVAIVHEKCPPSVKILTEEEIRMLLNAAKNGSRAGLVRRDIAVIQLLVDTGLRLSEVVDLQKTDLIFDFPGIHLRVRPKSQHESTRDLPMSGDLCRVLDDYLKVRPESRANSLFLSQEGRSLSPRTVQRIISDCAQLAGISGVSAQSIRRSYAVRLYHQTEDLGLVSRRLGHQNTAITEQYLSVPTIEQLSVSGGSKLWK
jgi:site-specific recombinase XerD